MRHAPFMLWINDLSAPDRLFDFVSYPIYDPTLRYPCADTSDGASMFIQQKMTPTLGLIGLGQDDDVYAHPIYFHVYILSIGQQYRIMKSAA